MSMTTSTTSTTSNASPSPASAGAPAAQGAPTASTAGAKPGAKTDRDRRERMTTRPAVAPAVDVYENADALLVVADIPGVGSDDLDVRLERDALTLTARRRHERGDFDYERTFRLPKGIDAERIEATLKDGTVRIRLPKSEKAKPRTIPVRAG